MKAGLPIMKNLLTPLAKSVLGPLGLKAAVWENRCSYSKENIWIRCDNINNFKKEMEYIIKIVKSLEESGSLLEDITETTKNEVK